MERRLFDVVLFGVMTAVAVVLGSKALIDLDLGWHLVGGLWVLENAAVPVTDPIGAQGNFWLAYSWLAEVLYAAVYQGAGFLGLQILQLVSVVSTVWLLLLLLRKLSPADSGLSLIESRFVELFSFFPLAIFAGPVWYLRPQLYSFLLFALLVTLAERKQLRLSFLIPMAAVWANIHVYWLCVPGIVLLYLTIAPALQRKWTPAFAGAAKAAFLFGCGVLNPYGLRLFGGMWEYLTQHKEAYTLITEFQGLSPEAGSVFWLYLCITALILLTLREILKKATLGLIFLTLGCALGSLMRVKFLPLYGFVVAVLLLQVVLPTLVGCFRKQVLVRHQEQAIANARERRINSFAGFSIISFLAVAIWSFELPPPLTEERKRLFEIVEKLENHFVENPDKNIVVMNHFDDGGWLGLAFYLNRNERQKTSRFKLAIDGRTLVVGQERLREFQTLRKMEPGWCDVVSKWDPEVFLFPWNQKLSEAMENNRECFKNWQLFYQDKDWLVSVKQS